MFQVRTLQQVADGRTRCLEPPTFAGFTVVFLWLIGPLYATPLYYLLTGRLLLPPTFAWGTVIFGHNLFVIAAIPVLVRLWESKPLESIGLRTVTPSDLLNGLTLFVLFILLTDVTQLLSSAGATPAAGQSATALAVVPIWFGTIRAFTNGIAEELACRAYGIERLEMLTGSTWQAAGVAYCACVLSHCPVWGIHGALAMAPGQLAFVYCYVKWRSLPACALGHVLADLFGGVVWPRLPSDWQRRYWEFLSSSLPMR